MSVVKELISASEDMLNFGNYELREKSKLDNFAFNGDVYKVKTFNEITKLEKNGVFAYESVPGTAVNDFAAGVNTLTFKVEGTQDTQITVQLNEDAEYEVFEDGVSIGGMKTNLSGKLVVSVELVPGKVTEIKIVAR